jgi:SAM-dependent methyltransferase
MNGLEVWTQKLNAYRANRGRNDAEWWSDYASWYNRWAAENDYGRFIYPPIQKHIQGNVLELGAGTGIITQRLAKDAKHVDALEPSAAMRGFLKSNLAHVNNLTIIPIKIEDYLDCLRRYRAVVAVNAFYNIAEINVVLAQLLQAADYLALVIGTGQKVAFFEAIREQFVGREKSSPPGQVELSLVLNDLGVAHQMDTLDIPTRYTFPNQTAMIDWLLPYFSIPSARRQELIEFVIPHIQSNGKSVWFANTKKLALIQFGRVL